MYTIIFIKYITSVDNQYYIIGKKIGKVLFFFKDYYI